MKDLRCTGSLQVSYTRILHLYTANYLPVKLMILWTCAQAKCYKDWTKAYSVYVYMYAHYGFNAAKPQPLIKMEILGKRHLCSIIHFIYLTGILSFVYGSCLNTSMILSFSSRMPSMFLSFRKTFSNLL